MTSAIWKENSIRDSLIEGDIHVVVLDDSGDIRDKINEVITKKLGWKVIIIESRADAVKLCQDKKAVFYILDINMGAERSQEGIDTAEEIKQIDKNVFVCIFSGVPNLETYRRRASRVGVDYFENKDNGIVEGFSRIAVEMLQFQKNFLKSVFEKCLSPNAETSDETKIQIATTIFNKIHEVDRKLESIWKLEKNYQFNTEEHPELVEEDENIQEYESRKEDPEWREKYQNKYVAFADGRWLEDISADNLKDLLDNLRNLENKGKSIFYKKLPKNTKNTKGSDNLIEGEKVYELPMSFYEFYPSEDI